MPTLMVHQAGAHLVKHEETRLFDAFGFRRICQDPKQLRAECDRMKRRIQQHKTWRCDSNRHRFTPSSTTSSWERSGFFRMMNELGTYFTFDPAGEPFDDIGRDEVKKRSLQCRRS